MSEMSTSEAREDFSEVLNRAAYGKERVVLTRRGKRIVAMVPVEDLDLLEALEDKLDNEAMGRALKNPRNRKRIPLDQIKKELGLL